MYRKKYEKQQAAEIIVTTKKLNQYNIKQGKSNKIWFFEKVNKIRLVMVGGGEGPKSLISGMREVTSLQTLK